MVSFKRKFTERMLLSIIVLNLFLTYPILLSSLLILCNFCSFFIVIIHDHLSYFKHKINLLSMASENSSISANLVTRLTLLKLR